MGKGEKQSATKDEAAKRFVPLIDHLILGASDAFLSLAEFADE